jgi:hypothetical protein
MSIIWCLILSCPFFFPKFILLFSSFVGKLFVWVHFHPFYFLFIGDGPFNGSYVFDELGEYTYEDSVDWGESSSYFSLHGYQGTTVQLLG